MRHELLVVQMSLMRIAGLQVHVVDSEQGRMARPRVLPPGQRVDVWLELDMPESNGDVFQVCISHNRHIQAACACSPLAAGWRSAGFIACEVTSEQAPHDYRSKMLPCLG